MLRRTLEFHCLLFLVNFGAVLSTIIASEEFDKPIQHLLLRNNLLYVGGTDTVHILNDSTLTKGTSKRIVESSTSNPPLVFHLGEAPNNQLIFCSSFEGRCQLLNIDTNGEIRDIARSSPLIVSNKPEGSAIVLKGKYNSNQDVFWVLSSYGTTRKAVPYVALRHAADLNYVVQPEVTLGDVNELDGSFISYKSTIPYDTQFIYAFESSGFMFYVKNKQDTAYIGATCTNDGIFTSLVEFPITCASNGVNRKYVQAATISKAGVVLRYFINQRPAFKDKSTLGEDDQFLYAVFGADASSTSTSICVYSVRSLVNLANKVYTTCHIVANPHNVEVGPPELKLEGPNCNSPLTLTGNNDSLSSCQIIKSPSYTRLRGYGPLQYLVDSDGLLPSSIDLSFSVSAISVSVVQGHTVAFTTSPSGSINKLIIAEKRNEGVYKTEDLTSHMTTEGPLLSDIAVGSDYIYALTSKQVFAVPINHCSIPQSCAECTNLGDPHCGWCTLTKRCSTMEGCGKASSTGHWLQESIGTPGSGCITPTIEESYISLPATPGSHSRLKLNISLNQVPDKESDQTYRCCLFEGASQMQHLCTGARKAVEIIDPLVDNPRKAQLIECQGFNSSQIEASISPGEDHVTTDLILKIDETTFASIELTFYSCSRHTSCTSCAKANPDYSCHWCLNTHKCYQKGSGSTNQCSGPSVSNSIALASDSTSILSGWNHCPRLEPVGNSVILIPAKTHPNNLQFKLYNKQSNVDGYTCELTWDESERQSLTAVVTASPSNQYSILECQIVDGQTFDYRGSNSTKRVDIRINQKNMDVYLGIGPDSYIELYKCEEMKGTCSECLGVDPKYKCGWCRSKESLRECRVAEHCPAGTPFIEPDNGTCPDVEIIKISPTNAPIQGGTVITITGVNLGTSYDEIRGGVYVKRPSGLGNVSCTLTETGAHNPTRVICRLQSTDKVGQGPLRVDIKGSDNLYAESGNFSVEETSISRLSTTQGPISGGTRVTIHGVGVNVGGKKKVTMKLSTGTEVECELVSSNKSSEMVFVTPRVAGATYVTEITLSLDDYTGVKTNTRSAEFYYLTDSTVSKLNSYKGIASGGTDVTVEGTNLNIIQEPRMYLEPFAPKSRSKRATNNNIRVFACTSPSNSSLVCQLPAIPQTWPADANGTIRCNYGFILDGIKETLDLAYKTSNSFNVGKDPTFTNFGDIAAAENLKIEGSNLLYIGDQRMVKPMVKVRLTSESSGDELECVVTTIQNELLYCDMPDLGTAANTYTVTVHYGSQVVQEVGAVLLSPSREVPQYAIIGGGVGAGVLVIIVVTIIIVLKCRLSQKGRGMKNLQDKMDNLEMTVAKECKEAFTELQTDMTEMTADIAALHGLPFYEYNRYCMKVLFPPLLSEYDHPVMRKLEVGDDKERVERGLREFSKLINNKTFLLTFIRTLEQQRKFTVRDRVEIGSLISVALQPNMEYHTDILKTLLAELIERTMDTKKDPKILLRRNESVAEKMLSNWFAFLLQKFLKECAGEPLYLLFRAIKQQIDKGPVDAVTADAKYSLSEDKLLRQSVEAQPITLRFCSPDPHAVQDPQTVKVLNCDTISQAIDKILDTLYRNVPNSTKPARDRLTLEWLKPNGDRVAMSDDDPAFSKMESDYCKRLVTLQCYKITDNAMVALTSRQPLMDSKSSLPKYDTTSSNGNYHGSGTGDSLSRANSTNNILDPSGASAKQKVLRYHLVKPSEADVHQEADRNKMVSEIYLTRLLATKGTLQQFVDDLFETIFSTSHRGSALPLAIKYMFDFLDDQALLHNIGNADVIHHWKSNSLPLRFWVNVIKNPDFVFDIHKSNIVDACLSVVAQIFMDSCSLSEHRLGKESPSSKLLYAKDIPKYRRWVDRYYSDIKSMPAISDHEMAAVLAEESRQHRNEFNYSAAMYELFQYVTTYQTEVMNALKEDEFARKDRLAEQLDYVNKMLSSSRIC